MLTGQITSAILGVVLAGAILFLVRRDHLHGPYAVWWFAVATATFVLGVFPVIVVWLGHVTGISYAPVLPIIVGVSFILIRLLKLDIDRSKQERQVRRLTQKLAILEDELDRARGNVKRDEPADADEPLTAARMRILHLGKYYAPERGGIEAYTQSLAEYCVGEGDAVAALVHARPGAWRSTRESINGVDVCRVGCIGAPVYTPVAPAYPWQLARMLAEFRPDLLHLHLPNPSCFAALALPAARRIPWIVHWHADVPPDSSDWRLRCAYRAYRPFEQATLRRAHAVIATSTAYCDASIALTPWRAKTRVVALGIADSDSVADAGPAPTDVFAGDWLAGSLRLLAVGRQSVYKGFDRLIDALALLPDARLLLVGDGECHAALRARAIARGVATRVIFVGTLDEPSLARAYTAADVFVLPSRDRGEAFGLVLLEAMRAGLPVVATDIAGSGVGSVVRHGKTGLLVPVEDAASLAEAIGSLRDKGLRQRFGTAGRARFLEHFTLAKSAAAVSAIYREAMP